jgi:hypothetical protein
MQQQVFSFMGRRIELWVHPEPDHMATVIRTSRTFYELDVLMKCREIYMPGTSIIDVGANIGNHAIFLAPSWMLRSMRLSLSGQIILCCR